MNSWATPVTLAAAGIRSPSPRLSRRSGNPEPQPPSFSPQQESGAPAPVFLAAAGIQSPDYAPATFWQRRRAAGGRPCPLRHLPQRNLQYKKWAVDSRPGGNLGGETGRISPSSWPNTSASSAGLLRGCWSWSAPALEGCGLSWVPGCRRRRSRLPGSGGSGSPARCPPGWR